MKYKMLFSILVILGLSLYPLNVSIAEEGVTDTEIHIGQWGPQTGPAAAWGSVARGTQAYFEMINASGGIHGRKIVYHRFDDAYNPAKTRAGVKKLQEGTGIFTWVGGIGTSTGLAVKNYLMERKIPWISPSSGSKQFTFPPERYLFAAYPLYYSEARTLVKYAVVTLKKKTVAIIYLNDEYGKNALKGAQEETTSQGYDLVAAIPVEVGDTDFKPHVMELKKAGADVVLLWTTVSGAIRIIGTSKAMGFKPQFMSTSTCSDFPFMMTVSKGLWEGVICTTFGELSTSGHPLLKRYKKDVFDVYASKKERWGIFYYAGIIYAEPLVEALRRCGRDLTRENLVRELEGLRHFKGIGPELNYAPFDPDDPYCRQGANASFIIQCLSDGTAKQLTSWIITK